MCSPLLVQLRHLESFLAVVEEGQFAAAARRLFLSPPAVTAHIHALERQHLVEERNGMAPDSASDKHVTAQDLIISVAAGRGIGTSLLSLQRYYTWPGVRFIPIIDAPWEPTVLLTRRDDFRPEIQGFRALANILAQELGRKPASFSGLPVECGHSITAAD
jgi:DNA-binding transcriptional LysR family regulator